MLGCSFKEIKFDLILFHFRAIMGKITIIAVYKKVKDYSNALCGELSSSPFTKGSGLAEEKLSCYDTKAAHGRPMMEYIIVLRSKRGLDTSKVKQISLGSVSADEYKGSI